MKKILVIGSSNTDLIATLNHFPAAGETLEGFSFHQEMGGKGANQALAAHRAGGDVMFITSLGNDTYGQNILRFYKEEGINTSLSRLCDNVPTGIAMIWVDQNGENSIIIIPGANKMLTPEYINSNLVAIEKSDFIVLQMEIPYETVRTVCNIASQLGKKIILNVAPAYPINNDILKAIDILIVNRSEAETISGEKIEEIGEEKIIDKLLMKGAKSVILTLGSKGCWYRNYRESIRFPAFNVNVKDTTAAGDTFCGVLVVGISKNKTLEEALEFATAAAALCVTRLGAQPSIPTEKEIKDFLKKQTTHYLKK